MIERIIIILIDNKEIFVNIFDKLQERISNNKYIYKDFRQKDNKVLISNIVEFIAQIAISPEAQSASDWRIYGRRIDTDILKKISYATSVSAEKLTTKREQELICRGIMSEF